MSTLPPSPPKRVELHQWADMTAGPPDYPLPVVLRRGLLPREKCPSLVAREPVRTGADGQAVEYDADAWAASGLMHPLCADVWREIVNTQLLDVRVLPRVSPRHPLAHVFQTRGLREDDRRPAIGDRDADWVQGCCTPRDHCVVVCIAGRMHVRSIGGHGILNSTILEPGDACVCRPRDVVVVPAGALGTWERSEATCLVFVEGRDAADRATRDARAKVARTLDEATRRALGL